MSGTKTQLLRFAGVGSTATLVHVVAAFAAHRALAIDPFASNTFGFICATTLTYMGNYHWTFASRARHVDSLIRFAGLAAVSFLASSGIVLLTGYLAWPFLATLTLIAFIVPPISFLASKLWVFKDKQTTTGRTLLEPIILAAAVGLAGWTQTWKLLHADSSWYIVATSRWLDGAELYKDIVEVNPPWAFVLTAPSILLARATGIDVEISFIVFVSSLVAASLIWTWSILHRSEFVTQRGRIYMTTVAFVMLVAASDAWFGQREHLMVAFVLPYIFAYAFKPPLRHWERIAIAVFASAGLALKPYFLALPSLFALLSIIRKRSVYAAFSLEHLTMAVFMATYMIGIFIFAPTYIEYIVPIARLVYVSFEANSVVEVLFVPGVIIAVLVSAVVMVCLRRSGPADEAAVALLVAALAFVFAYLVQFKGWSYQRLPAEIIGLLAAAWAFLIWWPTARKSGLGLAAFFTYTALLSGLGLAPILHSEGGGAAAWGRALAPFIESETDRSFMALSHQIAYSFPLSNMVGSDPTSRYPSLWLIPGAVSQLVKADELGLDPTRRRALSEVLNIARSTTVEDFLEGKPKTVIVQVSDPGGEFLGVPFNYVSFFEEDERFRKAWRSYRKVGKIGTHLDIWKRIADGDTANNPSRRGRR